MPISVTLETKTSAVTATLENKVGDTITWDQATGTWQENEGTWDNPEIGATLEAKTSALTASLEGKT